MKTSLPIQLYEHILLVPLVRSLILEKDTDEEDVLELDLPPNSTPDIPSKSSQNDGSILRLGLLVTVVVVWDVFCFQHLIFLDIYL